MGKGFAGVIVKPFGGLSCPLTRLHITNPKKGHQLTPCIGASAIIGYSLKGIDAQITNVVTHKIFDPIVSARMAQGELEYLEVSEDEKKEIIQQWYTKVAEKKKEKQRKHKTGKGKEKEVTEAN